MKKTLLSKILGFFRRAEPKPPLHERIKTDLAKHPGSTALEVALRTVSPWFPDYAVVRDELEWMVRGGIVHVYEVTRDCGEAGNLTSRHYTLNPDLR